MGKSLPLLGGLSKAFSAATGCRHSNDLQPFQRRIQRFQPRTAHDRRQHHSPAFQYETEKQAIVSMVSAMNCDEKADRDVMETLFYGHAIESLGKGVVLYFPKLAVYKQQ
jgi:hypothetical protein